ncbi:MAG TPA: DUF2071 domain-containing protein [Verrucomicrobiae bacterium]|nr:DUF2071 domain-containing protein [Verrucomicrobiae bacterium]
MKALWHAARGIIDRRILLNYRVSPERARWLLPSRFRPVRVDGWAIAGICLIRLKQLRPRGLPAFCGLASENAALRVAVEWDEREGVRQGVFILRRETSSRVEAVLGGRIFPGIHQRAGFRIEETEDRFGLSLRSGDGLADLEVLARRTPTSPRGSVFQSLTEASHFFERGSTGYSPVPGGKDWEGLNLKTERWEVEPLEVKLLKSSFFDDADRFPSGTIQFDCALLMRQINHEWQVLPRLEENR